MRAGVLIGVGAVLAAFPAFAGRMGVSPTDEDLEALVKLGSPGVVLEINRDGDLHVARKGVAEVGSRAEPPYDGSIRIASNTKTFVAAVALQLVGEGRLSLDDTVEQRLPGLIRGNGNDGRRITLRNLLQHTSGLEDYGADLPIRSADDFLRERDRTYQPWDLVAMSMKHRPLWKPKPGETRFHYANVNYVLTGLMIEKVTGRPWETEVAERIAGPLGLKRTFGPGTSTGLPKPRAHSYYRFGLDAPLTDTTAFNMTVVGASGALVSTPTDLNRFLRALVGGRVLKPAQLAAMQTTIDAPDLHDRYPGARYGLGLIWRPLSCGPGYYWSHVGEGAASATRNGVTADGRRSVVLSMSAEMTAPEARAKQEEIAARIVDRALCET